VRTAASILAALSLAAIAFVAVETWQLGWVAGERDLEIVPIRRIADEALPLGYREGMLNAWVHVIRPGQEVDFHEHPTRAEMVAILRGRARVRGLRAAAGGGPPLLREETVGPGNLVFSPPTNVHAYANVGEEPLWTLVFMSPPVKDNFYLDGAPPRSALDFLVLPLGDGGPARGATVPDWARAGGTPWRGPIGYYPGIPTRLVRDATQLRGSQSGDETWVVLLQGSGRLEVGASRKVVTAPTWISLPSGRWTVTRPEESGPELVALELSLPRFDARLFLRSTLERSGLASWVPEVERRLGHGPWGVTP
jgi:mannose-6-phosphate isomerase-like protein (cupin superfamily)